MSTLLSRLFTHPRARVLPGCAGCQVGQGRECACRAERRPSEPTPTKFWWAYALLLVAVAALWRALS